MNKSIYIILLFIVFILQLFVPAQMVYQQEDALDSGTAYKFKTRPIDPSDPFRGKYIVLNYELNSFETNENSWNNYRGNVFVYLKTDADGFAAVKTVSKAQLDSDGDYFIAESRYSYGSKVNFNIPFNRFYMNENKAYDAEVLAQKAQRDTTTTCYGLVYVKDGAAVLDNVYINNKTIQEFVDEYQKEKH